MLFCLIEDVNVVPVELLQHLGVYWAKRFFVTKMMVLEVLKGAAMNIVVSGLHVKSALMLFMFCSLSSRLLHQTIGIVVPGLSNAPGAQHDPSNLCLLEATPGSGVACRPLLTVSYVVPSEM